jgi:hypothetical protein
MVVLSASDRGDHLEAWHSSLAVGRMDTGTKGLKQLLRQAIPVIGAIALILSGCSSANNSIERADDLGLPLPGNPFVAPPNSVLMAGTEVMLPGTSLPTSVDNYSEAYRDAFVEQWMTRSDYLCRQYKDKVIRASRDWRLGTDVLTTALAGLAPFSRRSTRYGRLPAQPPLYQEPEQPCKAMSFLSRQGS